MKVLLVLAIICVSAPALQADILDYTVPGTFDDSYGDTASVDVTHRSRVAAGNTASSGPLSLWNVGYGDLVDIAWGGNANFSGEFGEIRFESLTADPLTLNSFDLAGFLSDRSPIDLAIYDGGYGLLWNLDNQYIEGDNVAGDHSHFTPGISANTIILQWENPWGVGIDNVTFSTTSVPEPSTLTFFGMVSVLGLPFYRRRSRSHS